jgi:hypothetical protein
MVTKVILKAYSLIFVTYTGAIILAVSLGSLGSRPLALNGLDDCHLPCWNAITPQQTTLDHASVSLFRSGYAIESVNHHWRYMTYQPPDPAACKIALTYSRLVLVTELSECGDVSLGDVMAILGAPEGVLPSGLFDSFVFRNGTVVVNTRKYRCSTGFSLHAAIVSIRLRAQGDEPVQSRQVSTLNPLPWRGFVSRGHYQQLYPDAIGC